MGSERSGNKPLGRHSMADRLMNLKRSVLGKYSRDGIDADEQSDLDAFDEAIRASEMLGHKGALAVALLKDESVIDRAFALAADYEETYGSLAVPVWDLIAAGRAA